MGKIKTVFHWENIIKAFLLVILAGLVAALISGFFHFNYVGNFAIGSIFGWAAMRFSMSKWNMWHFE